MNKKGFLGLLIVISEWFMRLGMLTLIWFAYTMAGLIIFGFMPATAAMFSVIRKWIQGEEDLSIYKYFHHKYRKEFLKANLLGMILLLGGGILFADWRFFSQTKSQIFQYISYFIVVLSCLYFIVLLYIFPVFANYEYKTINYIKNSLLIAIMNPITTFAMIGVCILIYSLSKYLPGVVVFFCISGFAFALAVPANKAFRRIEKKNHSLIS